MLVFVCWCEGFAAELPNDGASKNWGPVVHLYIAVPLRFERISTICWCDSEAPRRAISRNKSATGVGTPRPTRSLIKRSLAAAL